MTLGEKSKGFHVTYFSQFHGALKLLASNYEEDCKVDARVESGLQFKALPIPTGKKETKT